MSYENTQLIVYCKDAKVLANCFFVPLCAWGGVKNYYICSNKKIK